jgi:tetratricopeptide (TPR) repeat protein
MCRKALPVVLAVGMFFILPLALQACMWDYDTLKTERSRFPDTLELITGKFLRHSPEFYQWRIKDREQRLKDHPSELGLYDDLGVAYDKIGNDEKAIGLMLQKEHIAPGLYETYANLGTFYLHSGQYDKGVAMIDKALDLNPDAHFGREKYQKYLAEYVATRAKDGKVVLPLTRTTPYPASVKGDDEEGWKAYRIQRQDDNYVAFLMKSEKRDLLSEDETYRATKGILGIMKFGKHNSPVILEVLANLLALVNGDQPFGKGKELAGRALLKASYEVKDDAAKKEYRQLAKKAIEYSQPNHRGLTLDEMESDFKKELADADAWYADLREKEIGWIRNGQNPEAEFDKLYVKDPAVASPTDEFTIQNVPWWWRPVVIIGGFLAILFGLTLGALLLVWRMIIVVRRRLKARYPSWFAD